MRSALLLALALALAWLLVRGHADHLARHSPERALAVNGGQPAALLRMAERSLRAGELDAAEAAARAALAARILDGGALRVLGAVAERRGDRARALGLMRAAAAIAPRDAAAQFWLAINALADRDVATSVEKLDRLLRAEPELQRDVFPVLATIATNPLGARVVAPYLAGEAPWRNLFLSGLFAQVADVAPLERLLRAIESAGGSIRPEELERLAAVLWRARDWRRLRTWLGRHQPGYSGAEVLDPGFDRPPGGPWLGWQVEKAVGVDALVGVGLEQRRGARLVFLDLRVPYRHLSQRLLLAPGRYVLQSQVRARALETPRGLRWQLSCAETGQPIALTEHIRGDHDWRALRVDFEVPPRDCGGQELRLVLDARIAAEQQIRGELWIDELTVRPADPGVARDPALSLGPNPDNLPARVPSSPR